ncbi:MAG: energy transducer TonB [Spirochaetales bacterium]|nr:energy transducer TonB [Spirochaetales bacterium]
MTLSLDNKRLGFAILSALLFHFLLFAFIDLYLPQFRTEPESMPLTEMSVELSFISTNEASLLDSRPAEAAPVSKPEPVPIVEQEPLSEPVPVIEQDSVPESPDLPLPEPQPEFVSEPDPGPDVVQAQPPVETAENIETNNHSDTEAIPSFRPVAGPVESTPPPQTPALASPPPVNFSSLSRGRKLAAPAYPAAARRWKLEGSVRVAIEVGSDGRIISVDLKSSSGHSLLDREVISTIEEKWSFNPPGRRITLIKDFTFRLQ